MDVHVYTIRSGLTTSVLPLITSDQDLIGPGALYAGILAIAIPGRVLFSQVIFVKSKNYNTILARSIV